MSAIFFAIANCAEAGDNIICASQLYGGTLTQTQHTLKRFGIEARFFDVHNPDSIEALIDAVDVVDIVTPTLSHYDCAKQAIAKGKHIFIEKPIEQENK